MGLSDVLDLVKAFREKDRETPVVLMGYENPIEAMGVEKFVAGARAAGAEPIPATKVRCSPPNNSHCSNR